MSLRTERALAVCEGQYWLSKGGSLIQVTRVNDDGRIEHRRVAGPVMRGKPVSPYSLTANYEQVEPEEL
jgi:hypothetical protein